MMINNRACRLMESYFIHSIFCKIIVNFFPKCYRFHAAILNGVCSFIIFLLVTFMQKSFKYSYTNFTLSLITFITPNSFPKNILFSKHKIRSIINKDPYCFLPSNTLLFLSSNFMATTSIKS